MNEIIYTGEHLGIGNAGKLAVYLSFAASILSTIFYFFAAQNTGETSQFWRKWARVSFWVHSTAALAVFAILFVIIQQHYFEYQYAFQHSSRELPLRYMISCFWEGQEGSFLLWIIWHVLLGNILIYTAKIWENHVMTMIGAAQIALSSMLLGFEIMGQKIGSNPFILLRDFSAGAPIFAQTDYLKFIKDGNGLNPLLQNYWMVIHPPTLFLGFAATIVPFAYAIAGLWRRDYSSWIKPALPWSLVAVMVLGTGIIMGGFWAYESLSFGGYWAWDPVENASLIPWLILISAVHTMLIFKSTGNSLITTFLLTISSFLLVLYATFLTRSGILGDSSVHSFTDLGMSGQLVIFLMMFIVIAIILLITRWKELPTSSKDDKVWTREFWMFMGALVFVLSGFQVLITTSIPVINALFGLNMAEPVDKITYYNSFQLPFAIVIGILTAFSQFLKYRKNDPAKAWKPIFRTFIISVVLGFVLVFIFPLTPEAGYFETQGAKAYYSFFMYALLLIAGVYAVIANGAYVYQGLKGKWNLAGASVSHIGFGLLLIGVLVSSAKKEIISSDFSGDGLNEVIDMEAVKENILLFREKPKRMGDYMVTYLNDTTVKPDTYFRVLFERLDKNGVKTGEQFVLEPNAQVNPKMGLVANPDTRHYLSRDIFTHVTSIPKKDEALQRPYENAKIHQVKLGDSIQLENALLIIDNINPQEDPARFPMEPKPMVLASLGVKVITESDTFNMAPLYAIDNDNVYAIEEQLAEAGVQLRFMAIVPNMKDKNQTVYLLETATRKPFRDFIILRAIVFPWINLLWAGTIIMIIGFCMAIFRRIKEYNKSVVNA